MKPWDHTCSLKGSFTSLLPPLFYKMFPCIHTAYSTMYIPHFEAHMNNYYYSAQLLLMPSLVVFLFLHSGTILYNCSIMVLISRLCRFDISS